MLTLEVLKYCTNARGALNLWTLEMSNKDKVYEILSCVGDISQYKYTRGVIISRAYVQTYSGVEIQKLKIIIYHCYSIECYLQLYFMCICLRYDCANKYPVILQMGLSQRKGGMIQSVWLYYATPLLNSCSLARTIVYIYVCNHLFTDILLLYTIIHSTIINMY